MINYHKNYFQNNTKLYVFLGLAALGAIYNLYTYVPGCLLMDEFYADMNHITQPLGQPTIIEPKKRCDGPTVLEYFFENTPNNQYQVVVDNLRASDEWEEISVDGELSDKKHFCKGKVALHTRPIEGEDGVRRLYFSMNWSPSNYCYKNN